MDGLSLDIELDKIEHNPFATREIEDLEILAGSMKDSGLLSPICVRRKHDSSEKFELVFGHRRFLAAKKLGWKSIRAEVISASNEEMIIFSLAENINRSDFKDYEKAKLLQKMRDDYGWTVRRTAEALGKSSSFVSQHLEMLNIFGDPPEVESQPQLVKLLSSLSERHARILLHLQDLQERIQVAKLIVLCNLGVRETQRYVDRMILSKNHGRRKPRNARLQEIQNLVIKDIQSYENKSIASLVSTRHDRFTLFDDSSPIGQRLDYTHAIDKHVRFMAKIANLRYDLDSMNIESFTNTAVVTFFTHYDAMLSGLPMHRVSRVTVVAVKERGSWKIVHEHWSPIPIGQTETLDPGSRKLQQWLTHASSPG